MSAILGVFDFDATPAPCGLAQHMFAGLARRGIDATTTWSDGTALLGASQHGWEASNNSDSEPLIASRGHLTVVADASVYYRADLCRRLGIAAGHPHCAGASQLILAAYEKWGERCVEFLEGDYACIIWDARGRRLFLTRDFSGQRPLFYARRGSTVVVASTIGGVLAHPAVRSDLDLPSIAIDASALFYSGGYATCYRDISVVPAGCSVTVLQGPGARVTPWWDPMSRSSGRPTAPAEAAEELKAVLGEAVLQRVPASGTACVWLSGGLDSTAVFAAGHHAIKDRRLSACLSPVSLRLAADDPLNEDRFIEAVADHWQSRPHWLHVRELGPVVSVEGSGARDEPYRHFYDDLFRRLSEASLTTGARVALAGHGGDFLFQVSPVILADYLAGMRFPSLVHEWRALGARRSLRTLVYWAILPLMPQRARHVIGAVRGTPLHGYFERPVPTWLSAPFAKEHGIAEQARTGTPQATRGSCAVQELHWFLTEPHFARTAALCAEYALETGVQLRAPMLDVRVVRFAASRPASERRLRGESKVLLRRGMKGLLPDVVLAPRRTKTGTLATYFAQSFASIAPVLREAFRDPVLAQLGIAAPEALARVSEQYLTRGGTPYIAEQLASALQCELWLKARVDTGRGTNHVPLEPSAPFCASIRDAHVSGTSRQLSVGGM